MIIADLGLSSSRSRVRLAAVGLTQELCHRLPLDILNENLTALVLGLFPVLEGTSGIKGEIACAGALFLYGQFEISVLD